MRVVLFTEVFFPKVDGIVNVLCLLLDHLYQQGIEVMIVTPRYGDRQTYHDFPIYNLWSVPLPLYPEVRLALPSRGLFKKLKEFDPHIAHFAHPFVSGIPAFYLVKHRLNIPILISFHLDYEELSSHFHIGFMRPIARFLTRRILNQADYNLAPSRFIQQRMIDTGIQQEIGLWRRGVDSQKFHLRHRNAAMRERLSAGNPDDTLLVYVGRLSREKQIHHLIPVLEALPHLRLAIVGDGPLRKKLERQFKGTKTVFTGYLQGEELLQAYASGDVFVLTSAMESFALVVLEAMASGIPVVASRVGGVRDVVEEGRKGYSYEPGDVNALVAAVKKITSNRERMQEMGIAARAFAETQQWSPMMDEVIEHYERLISDFQRRV